MKTIFAIILLAVSVAGQERIVFNQWFPTIDYWDVFVVSQDRRIYRSLVHHTSRNVDARVSPNGLRVAFSSDRDWPAQEIFVMDLTGSRSVKQLTDDFFIDRAPDWSADGTKIVFERCDPAMTACDIFVVNTDGLTAPTPLTASAQNDDNPRFSPDGSKIVFTSNRDGNDEIYKCDSSGANVSRLTNNAASDGWPSWSPDGSKIIFSSRRASSDYELYQMNADGSGVVRITNGNGVDDVAPSISSSGMRLVWSQKASATMWNVVEAPMSAPQSAVVISPVGEIPSIPHYAFISRKVELSRFGEKGPH
jgi:Tol biopolymer transport system component